MKTLALFVSVLVACAAEPDTRSTTQDACQLDPTTGMCPTPDYEQEARDYAHDNDYLVVACAARGLFVCCTIVDGPNVGTICAGPGGIIVFLDPDPEAISPTLEACQLDPTTGMCPQPDTEVRDSVREIEHTQYPSYLETSAGCSHHSDGLTRCWASISIDGPGRPGSLFITCEGYPGGGVHCSVIAQ